MRTPQLATEIILTVSSGTGKCDRLGSQRIELKLRQFRYQNHCQQCSGRPEIGDVTLGAKALRSADSLNLNLALIALSPLCC